jgi:hypothetical protein
MFLQELCKFFKDAPLTFGKTNQLNNEKHEKIIIACIAHTYVSVSPK